eukprot:gene949-679_t
MDILEVHHHVVLLGFGCDAFYPYMTYLSFFRDTRGNHTIAKMVSNYRAACHSGILKIMSKMGISCLQSYKGAQLFNIVGVHREIVDKCFVGAPFLCESVGFAHFEEIAKYQQKIAYPSRELPKAVDGTFPDLPNVGEFTFQCVSETELHMNTPDIIWKLQEAAKTNSREAFKQFSTWQDSLTDYTELRGQMDICYDLCDPVDINEVESVTEIVKRFATGAMSYGSISPEAYETLGVAMNRLGGKSNCGEGGEPPENAKKDKVKQEYGHKKRVGSVYRDVGKHDSSASKIRQVASGRFGVDLEYLCQAEVIEIKVAQGAGPGEGGAIKADKITDDVAKLRKTTPGVGLISPPSHHDVYSIEDVAQLIYDLRHVNPQGKIAAKLVSRLGAGVIASGLVKAKIDVLTVAGGSGGTANSKLNSIKHCGLPWEIGLAETHQSLVINGLRDRVTLAADGQIRTGKDVIYAALLGAEEVSFSTIPLIAMGCIQTRKCHLNTCPVGICTMDPELRKKFAGKPEYVMNYMFMVAEDIRRMMAKLGMRKFTSLVGRVDLLRPKARLMENPKTASLDLSALLKPAWTLERMILGEEEPGQQTAPILHFCLPQDKQLAHHFDYQILDRVFGQVHNNMANLDNIEGKTVTLSHIWIRNTDRAVGTILSSNILERFGKAAYPGILNINFIGSGGQSFGAFLCKGVIFSLDGDANDGVAKGLSGGTVIVRCPAGIKFRPRHNTIVGNSVLYGATSGKLFCRGMAAERFAVRNSGACAVVEGCGNHGCEYMSGGVVVMLGPVGRNFAAGMVGGVVYIVDLDESYVNRDTILIEALNMISFGGQESDGTVLLRLVQEYAEKTGSLFANELLKDWKKNVKRFRKIIPRQYKTVLEESIVKHLQSIALPITNIDLDNYQGLHGNAFVKKIIRTPAFTDEPTQEKLIHNCMKAYKKLRGTYDKKKISLAGLGIGGWNGSDSDAWLALLTECEQESKSLFVTYKAFVTTVRSVLRKERSFRWAKPNRQLRKKYNMDKWNQTLTKKYATNYERFKSTMRHESADENDTDDHMMSDGGTVTHAQDIEDLVRPSNVAYADKRLGFHLYSRRDSGLRDAKDRTLDWDPIMLPAASGKASRRWKNLINTQAARCMDCSTPSCSYPNQGGGGCPLGNRVPEWADLVHADDWKKALESLLETCNFPEFTGSTCSAPCEQSCVLGINEEAVAIRTIEHAIIEQGFAHGWVKPQMPTCQTGKRVAIVGSGPCGLTCAQQLNKSGHEVVVYERAERPGGLLTYGIPNMKLDKSAITRRIEMLQKEGIVFRCGVEIGERHELTLGNLLRDNDAVVLSTGSTQPRGPRELQGGDLRGITQAVDFLRGCADSLADPSVRPPNAEGMNVVVIGGGDTGVDCVASAFRLGAKSVLQFSRRPMAKGDRSDKFLWPSWSDSFHVSYADDEGIATQDRDPREYDVQTTGFLASKSDVSRVGSVATVSVKGSQVVKKTYDADLVILAMGFTGTDKSVDPNGQYLGRVLRGHPGAEVEVYDADYGEYQVKKSPFHQLFVAGDCRRGTSLVVTAMAEGRDVAHQVDKYLMGDSILPRCAGLKQNPHFYHTSWAEASALEKAQPGKRRGRRTRVQPNLGFSGHSQVAEGQRKPRFNRAGTTETSLGRPQTDVTSFKSRGRESGPGLPIPPYSRGPPLTGLGGIDKMTDAFSPPPRSGFSSTTNKDAAKMVSAEPTVGRPSRASVFGMGTFSSKEDPAGPETPRTKEMQNLRALVERLKTERDELEEKVRMVDVQSPRPPEALPPPAHSPPPPLQPLGTLPVQQSARTDVTMTGSPTTPAQVPLVVHMQAPETSMTD